MQHVVQKGAQDWLFSIINNSFTSAQRIPQHDGYANCLKAASLSNSCYKLFYIKNSLGYARIGIVVSKKQFKLAVLRNQNKRLVRETFRQHGLSKQSIDLVVMARNGKMLSSTQKKLQLFNLFNQLESQCALC
ncbi:MAG: ribonuclease P protein component [Gallionella sp.]